MTTTEPKLQHSKDQSQEAHSALARNPGMPLDLDWIHRVHVNRSAVERRATTLTTRRTVKKEWQVAWLLRAITCIDLTTLAGMTLLATSYDSVPRPDSQCGKSY
ncbi:hypothetical protein KSX_38340 [Ktedonospora formicarum]|uniref:Uncharacterized protein n=1 Tax=Ktedonospora formicarum TaxID=2778364 RepID=A0A8J3MT96_9CHLR|nr:hypothetical protein [Ktedonospora formicarum]GHO45671.1 hypothetical protein KSX_38340 [Ktedonospora formicarum]